MIQFLRGVELSYSVELSIDTRLLLVASVLDPTPTPLTKSSDPHMWADTLHTSISFKLKIRYGYVPCLQLPNLGPELQCLLKVKEDLSYRH